MIFSSRKEAFVWKWWLNTTEPVVARRLEVEYGDVQFNNGKSYIERLGGSKPVGILKIS